MLDSIFHLHSILGAQFFIQLVYKATLDFTYKFKILKVIYSEPKKHTLNQFF